MSEEDIGIKRQYELYQAISRVSGQAIPVIDAFRFLKNPERGLRSLRDLLAIPYSKRMLAWPPGRRSSDGVWASHWYQAVEQSAGFQVFSEPTPVLTRQQQAVADEANEYYQLLLAEAAAL